jgi:simple sugar transport system permease protein
MSALEIVLSGFLISALRSATPLLFALIGETLTQRVGIINLGVEGQMLVGAMAGYGITALSGNPWLGLAAGAGAGMLLSGVHALLAVGARANQLASGLAVWMLGFGLSAYYGSALVGRKIDSFAGVDAGALAQLPVIGSVIAGITPTVLLGLLLVPVVALWLWRTRTGLRWRAVGESTEAARAAGVRPRWIQVQGIALGGLLSGLGGAALSVDYTRTWAEGMSAGRGLVAVGLVIVARWNPWWTLPAALLFGAAEALSLRLQAADAAISAHLLHTLPYLVSLAVLTLTYLRSRDSGAPILRKGGWGAQIVDEIAPGDQDIHVTKHRFSGFWDTELDSILRNMGVKTLFFAGVNMDQCVMTTLEDATFLGYDVLMMEDCVATTSPEYCIQATIYNVKLLFGFVTTSSALIEGMQGG